MLSDDLKQRAPAIAEDFHRLYYDDYENTWETTTWAGVLVRKNPCDLWIYQELIFARRPDLVIETGTAYGGSALYLAHLLDLIGGQMVVTVDIIGSEVFKDRPSHGKICYLRGDSGSPDMVARLQDVIHMVRNYLQREPRVMVILDSEHQKQHVARELEIYPQLVTRGQYLIVEDTNLNGRPVSHHHGPGPAEAIEEWFPTQSQFVADSFLERYYLTFNAGGYLRKIAD